MITQQRIKLCGKILPEPVPLLKKSNAGPNSFLFQTTNKVYNSGAFSLALQPKIQALDS